MEQRSTPRRGPGRKAERKAVIGWALLLALLMALLPVVLCRGNSFGEGGLSHAADAANRKDAGQAVHLLKKDGSVEEITMERYLWGVAAAEMPVSFEPEALKAQICAARTYTAYLQAHSAKHPQADVCTDSHCCQAYIERSDAQTRWGLSAAEYTEKLERAVAETDGLGILYQEKPIQALFFSSASGQTVDAIEVWGHTVDYLRSVSSPEGEEVPNYHSQVVLSAEEAKATILAAYPGADLSGDPSGWFSQRVEGDSGGVASILVGGVTLTGKQVRGLFALRSMNFTVAYQEGTFIFDVTGYGHGVGMSQYGANAMAKQGKDFREILTWYYTGTRVDSLWQDK